jgi:hypothetical protein
MQVDRGRIRMAVGRWSWWQVCAMWLLATGLVTACGADPPGGDTVPSTEPPAASAEDRPAILAAAAVELVRNDNGFGRGPDPFVAIDVVERLGAPAEGGLRQDPAGAALTDADRAAIAAAFAPRPVTWVPRQFDPGTSPSYASGAAPEPPRAVVLLGAPEIDGDAAKVAVSLGCGRGCFTGGTYALHERDGTWNVTGKVGPWWIT